MATKIEGAELLIDQACDLKIKNLPMTKEAAIAKYYASEVSVEVSTDAVQIFGGYGYIKDFPAENIIGIANYVPLAKVPAKFKN